MAAGGFAGNGQAPMPRLQARSRRSLIAAMSGAKSVASFGPTCTTADFTTTL